MRSDMNKVVTERPRRGSRNKSLKTGRRLSKDELPYYEEDYIDDDHGSNRHPISRHSQFGDKMGNGEPKDFSDLIGPLQRYLHKQVGRSWNKVYSDLSKSLDKRTVSGNHIWTHVFGEVTLHCEIREDNQVYEKLSGRYTSDQPVEGLYIHPVTGILCYTKKRSFKYKDTSQKWEFRRQLESFGLILHTNYWPYTANKFNYKDWIIVDDLHVLQNVKSKWMLHTFKDLNPEDVIAIKLVRDKIIEVRRKDKKGAILKQRIGLRQIGRRDKEYWKLTQGDAK